jgi:hypothetical protein
MSYQYSSTIGLTSDGYRPAGQLAVYGHVIQRLRDKLPNVVYTFGSDPDYHEPVAITYSLEYPDKLIDLPFVAITFVSELSRNVGIGQVPGGIDFGEFQGMTKDLLFQIDVWGRNSMERDMIGDAIMYVMQTSRNHFSALGFRDMKPDLGQTRMFEQSQSTLYPRISQTTTRVWRKVMSFQAEYDLNWIPQKDLSSGTIEQIDVTGGMWDADYTARFGYITDLILDSRYALEDHLGSAIPW